MAYPTFLIRALPEVPMASNYGAADASNTAVRAFLWKAGAKVWKSNFNVTSAKGKQIWRDIRYGVFGDRCAYCGVSGDEETLTIDHLQMVNRFQVGIHHPGNIAPCCKKCQTRKRTEEGAETWQDVLRRRCEETGGMSEYDLRESVIFSHMTAGEYGLPELNEATIDALKIICNRLYKNTTKEVNDSVDLYESLLKAFASEGDSQ